MTWTEVHVGAGAMFWTGLLQPESAPWLPLAVGMGAIGFYQADHLMDAWQQRKQAQCTQRDQFFMSFRYWVIAGILLAVLFAGVSLSEIPQSAVWTSVFPAALGTLLYIGFVYGLKFRNDYLRATLIAWVFATTVNGLPTWGLEWIYFWGIFIAAWVNVMAIRSSRPWILLILAFAAGAGVWIWGAEYPFKTAIIALLFSQILPALRWKQQEVRAVVADWLILTVGLLSIIAIYF